MKFDDVIWNVFAMKSILNLSLNFIFINLSTLRRRFAALRMSAPTPKSVAQVRGRLD
jgi:hypothetical protein